MTTRISEQTRAQIRQSWPDILGRLAAGELVKDARAPFSEQEMRCYRTTEPQAQTEWDAARESSADAFMDEAMEIARTEGKPILNDKGEVVIGRDGKPLIIAADAALARMRVDTLKWAARIRNPRLYGDKAQLDVNVRTVDLTRIISEANARLANGRAPRILEHNQAPGADPVALIARRALEDLL